MKKLYFLPLFVLRSACGPKPNSGNSTASRTYTKTSKTTNKAKQIVDYALSFQGVRYRYGGTTRSGMDCSGLIFKSFDQAGLQLPRISRDMAKRGVSISLAEISPGDLLFFKTDKSSRQINHVGLIVSSSGGDVEFIHATTSKGVIISRLTENYWRTAFVGARRVL